MVNFFGPAPERLAPAQRASAETFHQAVGSLTDGSVVFPEPFDLETAAVLAGNDTDGCAALDVYEALHAEVETRYHVQITQIVADQPDLRREVIDAVVRPDQLRSLLRDAIRTISPNEGHL